MKFAKLHIIGYLGVILLISACSSVKNMPPGAHRLNANKVVVENNSRIKPKQLEPYIRQQPNRNLLLGLRPRLGIYNAAPRSEANWLQRTLKKVLHTLGEAPVVLDDEMTEQSRKNIEQYLRTRGYFNVQVGDTVIYNRHKAKVIYTVRPDTVFRVRSMSYNLGTDTLARAIVADSLNSLLRAGAPLSSELMDRERTRLVSLLHNQGFYSFGKNQIVFEADSIGMHRTADLIMVWSNHPAQEKDMPVHQQYKIRNVAIYSDYDVLKSYTDPSYVLGYQYEPLTHQDIHAGNMGIYYHSDRVLRRSIIQEATLIRPGDEYNETKVTRTYNNLTALGTFRVVNIQFSEVPDSTQALVDCAIRLTPASMQGFKFGVDASVSTNALYGIAPAVSYFHRNLWKGGEYFNLSFSGNFQFKLNDRGKTANELTVNPSLSIPRFLFPWLYYSMQNYKPRTEFTAAYSYQFRSDYTRNAISFSFGYTWRPSLPLTYHLNLINLNIVHVDNLSESFYEDLKNPFLLDRYRNHFVMGAGLSMIHTDRRPDRRENSHYLRWNIKTAGNVLSAFNSVLPRGNDGYKVLGNSYSQFAKTDVNYSFYHIYDNVTMMAYRVYGGVGRGYGNSVAMPLEEDYFSGGAFSLRGWQARTLGPGAAVMDSIFSIPNQAGDIKLEANMEFRFKISGPFEGALFLDIGNIWSLNPDDTREGAFFKFDEFYKQLAVNTGLGLRLNFGFIVFRLDWGMRVHDPLPNKGWISPGHWLKADNSTFCIGIGYPF